jgi:hypothetical protein
MPRLLRISGHGQGLGAAAELLQRGPEVCEPVGEHRVQAYRLAVVGEGLLHAPALAQGIGDVVVGRGKLRIEREGLPVRGDRLLRTGGFLEQEGEVVVRRGLPAAGRDGAPVGRLGSRTIAQGGTGATEPGPSRLERRRALDRPLEILPRRRKHPEGEAGLAAVVEHGRIVRALRERAVEQRQALGRAAGAAQREAEEMERIGMLGHVGEQRPQERLGLREIAGLERRERGLQAGIGHAAAARCVHRRNIL